MDPLTKVVVGIAALLLVIPLALAGPVLFQGLFANLLQFGAAALAAGFAFRAARSAGKKLPWLLLASSSAAWAIGQGIWTVQEETLGAEVPFPGPSDAGFLLAAVLAVPAILLFMKPVNSRREPWMLLLDGLGASLLLMIAGWVVLLRAPTLAEPNPWKATIGALYPALDLVILGALLSAFPRLDATAKRRLWPLAAGMVCITAADLAFNYTNLTGSYQTGQVIDLGWVAGSIFIAYFAVRPGPTANLLHAGAPTRLETALPFVTVPIAGGAVAYDQWRGIAPDPVFVWMAVGWLCVVSLRQFLLLTTQHALLLKVQQGFAMEREAAGMRERVTELERLQSQEQFRTEFINKTAHEFATPLTPIRVTLKALSARPQDEATQRQLANLDRNVTRLSNLADDLIDAARIDSAKLVLNRRNLDLGLLVENAMHNVRETLDARQQAVRANFDGERWVLADPVRLEQAITSLILRAAEANPPGGTITIEAKGSMGAAHVAIVHEGSFDSKAFEPFGVPGTAAPTGSAVSLHLARGLLRLHGTDLVHTRHSSGGRFTFTLPTA